MKLLRINHTRCQEHDGSSYLWVPDDLTEDALYDAIEAAEKAYLADLTAWQKEVADGAPPNPGYSLNVNNYPDTWTKLEMRLDFAQKKAKYDEYQKMKRQASKNFTGYVVDQIEGALDFSDGFESTWSEREGLAETLVFDQDWGHMHGTPIKYGERNIWAEDKKGGAYRSEDYLD